jgi:hypothetical protein
MIFYYKYLYLGKIPQFRLGLYLTGFRYHMYYVYL